MCNWFTVFFSIFIVSFVSNQAIPEDGQTLFTTYCVACHSIGDGPKLGPDLKGISDRRTNDWIKQFIKSSQAVVNSGDKDAVAVFKQFNSMIMPDQPLNDSQINAVISYIDSKTPKASSAIITAESIKKELLPISKSDIAKGKQLFQGTMRLYSGGPACNTCHNVQSKDVFAGGSLAADLTEVIMRAQRTGTQAIIENPPFPAMKAAYDGHPVSNDEAFALTAFLVDVNNNKTTQGGWPYAGGLFGMGILGAGSIFFILALFGFRRKKFTVNKSIFDRQESSN